MRSLFNQEGPVISFLIKVFDLILLSIIWCLFSIPIVTIGASSAALYTTVLRCMKNDEGHIWKTFLNAFMENLKRSTLAWMVVLVLVAILVADAFVLHNMAQRDSTFAKLYWIILVLICIVITWMVYLSAYCARFNGSLREVLKISLQLMIIHPVKALKVLILTVVFGFFGFAVPGLGLILPAPLCWLNCITIEKIFRLHMRPEDLERITQAEQNYDN